MHFGGAEEDRTPDLLRARQALSQLSYGPRKREWRIVVGLGGFEPPTSPLSGVRSNQLSYRPSALKQTIRVRTTRFNLAGPSCSIAFAHDIGLCFLRR